MKMSDFAKNHLLKFGWIEGKGLGKDENGIVNPIKMPIKPNCEGLGYKKILDKWWEEKFDTAVQNIQVKSDQNDTILSKKERNAKMPSPYIKFKKTSVLHGDHLIKDDSISGEKETVQSSVNVFSMNALLHPRSYNEVASHTATRSPSVSGAKQERIALQDESAMFKYKRYLHHKIRDDKSLPVFETENPSYNASFKYYCANNLSSAFLPSDWSSKFKETNKTNHTLNEKEKTEEDEYETNNNIMLQTLRTPTQYKSRSRKFRKKMNNLMQQLNSCRIKETEKSNLLKDKFLRNVRSRKESSKIKKRFEQLKLIQDKDIVNINKKTESQDELEYKSVQMQLGTNNDTSSKEENYKLLREPLANESTCLITLTKLGASEDKDTDRASAKNMKNLIYFHKTKKKNRNKHKRNQRSKIEDVIKNIANKRDIEVVTKALTDINLTENVSSKIKKKPTQTHITPV